MSTTRQVATIMHLQNREANLAHRLFNLLVEVHLLRAGFCHGKPKPMEFRATRGPGNGARKAQQ
jgi:hypothetical protein